MTIFSKSVMQIVGQRKSVRDFYTADLPIELIDRVRQLLADKKPGPFGNIIGLHLVDKKMAQESHKVKLGTYGFISGARYFIGGGVNPADAYVLEDFGYILEEIILILTDMGLGTCWLGGTFSRKDFALATSQSDTRVVPAITPVGFASDSKGLKNAIIRWGAKSNTRKPWRELFFEGEFGVPMVGLSPNDGYGVALEMLRLAPSASNKQPWRIVKLNDTFHFYMFETPGYANTIKAVRLQRIDMGIAMSHFELACNDLGLIGEWQISDPCIESGMANYLVSWITK